MLAQRARQAAPAVRGVAETLPFRDGTFGAAMAVLTLHHWADKSRGLSEMRRVTGGPVIIFGGCDGAVNTAWWLHDYFPAVRRLVGGRNYSVPFIESVLGPATVVPVPIAADCRDGFEAAWWRRPHAILDPVVWRATSALSMISEADRSAGMSRLAADLADGTWERAHGHLLDLDELDLGYRVVIAG
jgi:SAM-dependent methyltransferase